MTPADISVLLIWLEKTNEHKNIRQSLTDVFYHMECILFLKIGVGIDSVTAVPSSLEEFFGNRPELGVGKNVLFLFGKGFCLFPELFKLGL